MVMDKWRFKIKNKCFRVCRRVKSGFLISLSFVINHRLFLVDFIVFNCVNKELPNTWICFVIFTYKFHFIAAIILSRQLIWGWLLYFRGSKTHCVSLYNSRCVKQTIAYKHAAWWVLMLHYIYCFLFMASGSMINLFPRNKIWKTFPFFLPESSS